MKTPARSHHPPERRSCRHVRLAESAVAAVDVCDCGMMQLHVGAVTLRLTSDAVAELLGTLGHAVAVQAARTTSAEVVPLDGSAALRRRGQA